MDPKRQKKHIYEFNGEVAIEKVQINTWEVSTHETLFVVHFPYINAVILDEHPLWRCKQSHLSILLVGEHLTLKTISSNVSLVLHAELNHTCCVTTASVMGKVFMSFCALQKCCAILCQAQVRRGLYGFIDWQDDWKLPHLKHCVGSVDLSLVD